MNDNDRNALNPTGGNGDINQSSNMNSSNMMNTQGRPVPQRPLSLQSGQANQLFQALKNELNLAKTAATEAEKSSHYAKAESIRQILMSISAQQNRVPQQSNQGTNSVPLSSNLNNQQGMLSQGRPKPMNAQQVQAPQGQVRQGSNVQTMGTSINSDVNQPPKIVVSLERLNQVKGALSNLDKEIQLLQNKQRNFNLPPDEAKSVEKQLNELKNKYTGYQKIAVYLRTQLMKQAKSGPGTPNAAGTPGTSAVASVDSTSRIQGHQNNQSDITNTAVENTPQPTSKIPADGKSVSPQDTGASATQTKTSNTMVPPNVNLSGIIKPSVPSMPIPATLNVKPPTAVTLKANTNNTRPTLTSGFPNGMGQVLGTPAILRMPTYDLASTDVTGGIPDNSGRVLTKRKLSELVNTIGADEGDGKTNIDGDVEELLLDLADEFISSVTGFACRLAKHRKVDSVDVRDVQLHLERNWNIRIPGYAMDEIRSTRKWSANQSYNQKLSGVEIAKSINGNMS